LFRKLPISPGSLIIPGLGLTLVGMLAGNALMSIGHIALLVIGLLTGNWQEAASRFRREPLWLGLVAVFLVYVFGGIGGGDTGYWLDKLRVKLPFLALPLAFALLPDLPSRAVRDLLLGYVLMMVLASAGVWLHYALDPAIRGAGYVQGITMPTPVNHIRFSLMGATALALCLWMAEKPIETGGQLRGWLDKRAFLLGLAAFLLVFLHVLAVRSGLLAAYLVLLTTGLSWIVRRRKFLPGLAALLLAASLLWAGYQFIPTLKNRISYARYDMEQFMRGEVNPGLSDAKRIGSIQAGWQLFLDKPATGQGWGHLRPALKSWYAGHYPDLEASVPLPHNQFVLVAATSGLPGLLVFSVAVLLPLIAAIRSGQGGIIGIQCILLSSMLTEATLETQLGVCLYLVFTLLLHRYGMPDNAQLRSGSGARFENIKPLMAWQKDA
jgi:O-antigen ligase